MKEIYEPKRRKLHSLELRMKKLLEENEQLLATIEDASRRLNSNHIIMKGIREEIRIEIGEA